MGPCGAAGGTPETYVATESSLCARVCAMKTYVRASELRMAGPWRFGAMG